MWYIAACIFWSIDLLIFLLKYSWFTLLCLSLLIAKWLSYTYICFLFYFFSIWCIIGFWIWFPMLYLRTLLFIYSKQNSLHLPAPNWLAYILCVHFHERYWYISFVIMKYIWVKYIFHFSCLCSIYLSFIFLCTGSSLLRTGFL